VHNDAHCFDWAAMTSDYFRVTSAAATIPGLLFPNIAVQWAGTRIKVAPTEQKWLVGCIRRRRLKIQWQ